MADVDSINTSNTEDSLISDLEDVLFPAYAVQAILQGAIALFDADDMHPKGNVWAARELVELALLKVQEIRETADDVRIFERIHAMKFHSEDAPTMGGERHA